MSPAKFKAHQAGTFFNDVTKQRIVVLQSTGPKIPIQHSRPAIGSIVLDEPANI